MESEGACCCLHGDSVRGYSWRIHSVMTPTKRRWFSENDAFLRLVSGEQLHRRILVVWRKWRLHTKLNPQVPSCAIGSSLLVERCSRCCGSRRLATVCSILPTPRRSPANVPRLGYALGSSEPTASGCQTAIGRALRPPALQQFDLSRVHLVDRWRLGLTDRIVRNDLRF